MKKIEKEVKILHIPKRELQSALDAEYERTFRGMVNDQKFDSSKILDKILDASLRIRTKIFDIIRAVPDNSEIAKIWQMSKDFSDNLYEQTWTVKQKVQSITNDGTKTKLEYSDKVKNFAGFQEFVKTMKDILVDYQSDFPKLFVFEADEKNFAGEKTFLYFIHEILGLETTENRKKHRIQWKWDKKDGVKWTIDEYENIPAFSEVEGKTVEIIEREIEKFWLSYLPVVNWWFKKLKKHYEK